MKKKQKLFLWTLILCAGIISLSIRFGNLFAIEQTGRTFGVTYMTMNNPFYPVLHNELIKSVEGNGDTLILRDPLLDDQKQIEQVEEFIERKVDGIFINPVNSQTIVPVLKKAADQGIPVIVVDCPVDESAGAITQIYSDNYNAGVLCAQDLVENHKGGNILLLKHSDAVSASQRIAGFTDTIKAHPEFAIVNERECYGQTEQAMPVVLDMLEETPDADFIMCLNDPSAIGAVAALEYLEREDIKVYGVDGMPEFKSLLASASSAEGTAVQSPYTMARQSAKSMYDYFEGKRVEKEIIIPVEFLNRRNADKNDLRSWQ